MSDSCSRIIAHEIRDHVRAIQGTIEIWLDHLTPRSRQELQSAMSHLNTAAIGLSDLQAHVDDQEPPPGGIASATSGSRSKGS